MIWAARGKERAVYTDAEIQKIELATLYELRLAISNSGETDELLRFLPYLLSQHIPVVAMSGNPQSRLPLPGSA